jgi:UDP-N-acetylmuramoyl-tripeptide--D-alanyl-D-alanine ligase
MFKYWLSLYSFQYLFSIVYMLQTTEYCLEDFVKWYFRVRDFNNVEKRQKLIFTTKTTWLLLLGFFLYSVLVLFCFWSIKLINIPYGYLVAIVIVIFMPLIVIISLLILLFLMQLVIQKPIEWFILNNATTKLAKHSGLKIAIAGSYGKTSTREILKTILEQEKRVATPPENHNTPLAISSFIRSLSGDEEIIIFELGEYYSGDILKLCQLVKPDIGIITGINETHLRKFKNIKNTTKTVYELAKYLNNHNVFVNCENKIVNLESKKYQHICYSRQGIGDWKISNVKISLKGTKFLIKQKNMLIRAESSLLGVHYIGPLVLSAYLGKKYGLSTKSITKGISKTKAYKHRLELKVDSIGVYVLDDTYNGNPDGVKAIIEFLGSLTKYRRIFVTPGLVEMGSQSQKVHLEIGRSLADIKIEKVVLIRNSVCPYIAVGLKQNNYQGEIIWFDNSLLAFQNLHTFTVKGDVVILQNDWSDQYS